MVMEAKLIIIHCLPALFEICRYTSCTKPRKLLCIRRHMYYRNMTLQLFTLKHHCGVPRYCFVDVDIVGKIFK